MYKEYQGGSLTANARNNFVSKVYSIVSAQLMVTVCAILLNIYSPTFAYVQAHYNSLFWLNLLISIGSMMALFFSPSMAKTFPTNMIVLGVFTLSESYLVSFICSMYTPESVLLAGVATLAATLGITFYAMTTKSDFTQVTSSFWAFSSGVFLAIFITSLVNALFIRSSFISLAIAWALAGIYSVYLLVDTQLILGGKNKSLSLDNYVLGSIIIYMDIISLFLQILKILGKKKND